MSGGLATRNLIRRPRRRRVGMGLVEMLLAISISATLLTATAYALDASLKAYKINQQQSVLLQQTRLTMNRVLSTVRRTKLHAPDDPTMSAQFATGGTVTAPGIRMYDNSGLEIIYRFDAPNQRVLMLVNGTAYPLIEGVQDFSVTMEPMRSANSIRTGGGWDLLKRATLIITSKSNSKVSGVGEGAGTVTLTLSGSVMPRRNTW